MDAALEKGAPWAEPAVMDIIERPTKALPSSIIERNGPIVKIKRA